MQKARGKPKCDEETKSYIHIKSNTYNNGKNTQKFS